MLDGALADGQLSGEEHRQRVATATAATTLGELQTLVADLQIDGAPVRLPDLNQRPPRPGPGWGLRAAIAGALVLLGIGIGWGLYGTSSSPLSRAPDPGAAPDGVAPVVLTPPRQLHSLGGLTGLFTQMRERFGDTTGYRLVVYPDYASLDFPDRADERRKFSSVYRGGWDDPRPSARSSGDRVVDLTKFDTAAIVGVLRGAPETLGIAPAEVNNRYLIIEPSGDPQTPEAVLISVYVSSEFGSGSLTLHPDGTLTRINYPG